ncbi:efflux RND transporter periplasmic adaptor subunit [Motilimonas pumila]|uniref:Efflux RND transporter periplasmic adaptor subunit n=1 Tax=Motilimonas pumila TaxID=2303987 RepID=A0A418Y9R7_9GAMM|nr:efflux RND transporter periplasmic adaptor subunit [Motilimonas pumila]RJG37994.1 efflux RND transporter periplasmic adaptor subunit [Motilimonas pumila]
MVARYQQAVTLSMLLALSGCSDKAVSVADKSPRSVNVVELGLNDSEYQQFFAGRLQAVDKAALAFRVPGTVQDVFVATGDKITKGQKLAQLDPHDYEVALMELQARLSEAESAHRLAASELARVKQAIRDNAIATVNLDRAKSAYERSKAAIEVVQQNINKAEDAIRYTTLLAPFDGVIGAQKAEQFEQVLPGIAIFELHEPSKLEAVIDVPESLINRFTEALEAKVFWYGYDDKLTAKASEIGTVPNAIKQTYAVVFALDKTNPDTLPGKAVIVEVNFDNSDNVFCLPYSALRTRSDAESVYVIEDGATVSKNVKIEKLLGDKTCVTGELKTGDKVVVSGVSFLKTGQTVGELIVKNAKPGANL